MDVAKTLKDIGLKEGEVKVYLALLKLGSSPVNKIKEETGLHRTTIYDFLEKLLNKGLVNYVTYKNSRYYRATEPSKLKDYIKEKEQGVDKVLPELQKIASSAQEDIKVQVYRGKEGIKTFMNDRLRLGRECLAFGGEDKIWNERFPFIMKQYVRDLEKKDLHDWILTSDSPSYLYSSPSAHYKFVPSEYFDPTPTLIYGDRVVIVIWEPLTVIIIQSEQLAKAYAKHFNLLWTRDFEKNPTSS